jgi:hypothetical protein
VLIPYRAHAWIMIPMRDAAHSAMRCRRDADAITIPVRLRCGADACCRDACDAPMRCDAPCTMRCGPRYDACDAYVRAMRAMRAMR